MKEDCDDIRPLLDAWIDGELSSSAARRVAHHVEGCPACLDAAESRRGIDAAISADDKAGDPGDAYFASLGDRVSARFDFAEAARHWAKPEEPPRRRRLAIPRAWVPRFAFGIAGAAVATIAGLLVHDLGRQPTFAPLPQTMDAMKESREQRTPAELSATPGATPSGEPAAEQSAGKAISLASPPKSAPPPRPAPRRQPPTDLRGIPNAESFADRVPLRREPTAVPDFVPPPKLTAAAPSPAFLAPQAEYAARADFAANAKLPGRTELLSFFGALSERQEDRTAASSAEMLSEAKHAVPPAATPLADSTGLRLRRDETRALADSTWIRLRRGEARALADSALATGTLEDCESALRAYWIMLHRDGRPLLPAPGARAKALESDRPRIAALLRCASR